jgi:cysteine-rich repeat protein
LGVEVCDDHFTDACGTCNETCTGPGTGFVCGDGQRCAEFEPCDDGPGEGEGKCLDDCSAMQICGDGVLNGDEICDDGNLYPFDACAGCRYTLLVTTKTWALDAAGGENLGDQVAVSVDTLVGAAPLDRGFDTTSGSAYVFDRNQGGAGLWGQVKRVLPSGTAGGDGIGGYSVSADDATAVIGVQFYGLSGAVYVLGRDQGGVNKWGEVKRVLPSTGVSCLGSSVSVLGDVLVAGAALDGTMLVFGRNQGGLDNWGQIIQLTPSDGEDGDRFGEAVSFDGESVAAGGYGVAYVFARNQGGPDNWGEVAKLLPQDTVQTGFGNTIAVSGDVVVVGAWDDDVNGFNAGAAYVFARDQGGANNWGQVTKLLPSDGAASFNFGRSVAMSGDKLAVGSPGALAVYLFGRNQGGEDNWGQVAKAISLDSEAGDAFGYAVSMSGSTVAVGAPKCHVQGFETGALYVFEFPP